MAIRPVYAAGDGDVHGPASSSKDYLPLFADATGKTLKSTSIVTAAGRALLDDNNNTEQRATLGLVKQGSKQDDTADRVMTTGAFGLGQGGIQLPVGTDLTTITSVGIYYVQTGPNVPQGFEYSTMLVQQGADVITQLMIGNQAGHMVSRGYRANPGTWGAWAFGWDSLNFDPGLKQDKLGFTPVRQGGGAGQDNTPICIGNTADGPTIKAGSTELGNLWHESNFTPASKQNALGFTPVQQGTGAGQTNQVVKMGWGTQSGYGMLLLTVDSLNVGAVWADNYGLYKVTTTLAQMATGSLGIYGLFKAYNNSSTTIGAIVAGTNLQYSDAGGASSGGKPLGSWRLLSGLANADGAGADSVGLYMRVL